MMDVYHNQLCRGGFWLWACFFSLLREYGDDPAREWMLRRYEFSDAGAREVK